MKKFIITLIIFILIINKIAYTLTIDKTFILNENKDSAFKDKRDKKIYKAIKIGEQWWMAENLNYKIAKGSWCYDNKDSLCKKYGRLYDWNTAQKVCPKGWHLPSKDEWINLSNSLGDNEFAGGKLKNTVEWAVPNTGATNESHFNALPSGARNYKNSTFDYIQNYTYFWTSTLENNESSWASYLSFNFSKISTNFYYKKWGFSVRCVKDNDSNIQ